MVFPPRPCGSGTCGSLWLLLAFITILCSMALIDFHWFSSPHPVVLVTVIPYGFHRFSLCFIDFLCFSLISCSANSEGALGLRWHCFRPVLELLWGCSGPALALLGPTLHFHWFCRPMGLGNRKENAAPCEVSPCCAAHRVGASVCWEA